MIKTLKKSRMMYNVASILTMSELSLTKPKDWSPLWKIIRNISSQPRSQPDLAGTWTLQTHHVYFTLKRRGNDRFHVVSTCNTRGVFVGKSIASLWPRFLSRLLPRSQERIQELQLKKAVARLWTDVSLLIFIRCPLN